jgi:hypothetical protein
MVDLIYAAWDSFTLWSAEQPIFLQAAIGMALFWVVLKGITFTFKLLVFIAQGLFQSRKDHAFRNTPRRRPDRSQTTMIEEEKTRPYFFR